MTSSPKIPTIDPEEESQIIDTIILNLKIISEIREHDKLSVNEEIISIDNPGLFQGIKRWYFNNNRKLTIEKIESIIEKTMSLTKSKINIIQTNNIVKTYFEEEISHFFHRIYHELINAKKGLENLKITYKVDISITSRIELVISKILRHIKEIESILKIKLD